MCGYKDSSRMTLIECIDSCTDRACVDNMNLFGVRLISPAMGLLKDTLNVAVVPY